MSLRDQLQAIYDREGILTPALVVEEARPPDHPLHDRLEWDDGVAGEAYRRDQARTLIRSVRVIYRQATATEAARTVRTWHAVRDEAGPVYRPAEVVVASPFLTELLLRDMEREWVALKRRWSGFAEFVQLVRRDLGDGEAA